MTKYLRNIPLKTFRQYLEWKGLKKIRDKGGHSLNRPITLQSHIDPVPEFIVKQALRTLNVDRLDFLEYLKR